MLNKIFLQLKKTFYYFISLIVIKKSLSYHDLIKYYKKSLIYYSESERLSISNEKYNIIGKVISTYLQVLNPNKIIEMPQPFVLHLKESWIVGKKERTPIFLDSKHRPILESCNSRINYLYGSGAIIKIFLSKIIYRKNMLQNIINITGTMTNNSYHWLADYLPRLEYFCEKLKKEDYYLLIDNKPTKYQLETLELFGIPSKKILRWTGRKTLCHNAFIPCMRYINHPSGIQIYSINSMNWVRTKLLKSTEDVPKKIKNIYITRKKASSRNLLNENRFIDYLSQYNFECLCLEDLSAKEIIAKFRDSKIIIAVHGAALSHTLFSSNCKIIEIFPSNFTEKTNRNPTHLSLHPFFQISSLFKLNHFVYVVQGNENFDINININEFSHFFESKILNLL